MSAAVAHAEDHLARGYEALASGDWPGAREAFAGALNAVESPEELDGLGRAVWWLREEREAVVYRERAGLTHLDEAMAAATPHRGIRPPSSPARSSWSSIRPKTVEVVTKNIEAAG